MNLQKELQKAIELSITHDEIVWVDVQNIEEAFEQLEEICKCEDYVDTYSGNKNLPMREVWGMNDERVCWRVHLVLE